MRATLHPRRTPRSVLALLLVFTIGAVVSMSTRSMAAGEPLVTIGVEVDIATADKVTYELAVTNHSTVPANDVIVVDTVPTDTTFESSEPDATGSSATTPAGPGCTDGGEREPAGTKCEWHLSTVDPGETATISASFNIDKGDRASFSIANVAEVTTSTGQKNSDTDPSLHRDRIEAIHDAYVTDTEPPDSNHGACEKLRATADGANSAFVEFGPMIPDGSIERLWAGELRGSIEFTDHTEVSPGVIGLHRITSGVWSEGPGPCGGAMSDADTARTGNKPAASDVATATAAVAGAERSVFWDVSADLDSPAERAAFHGWTIRDVTTGGAGTTELDSSESATESQRPRLFLVYTEPEPATCIDVVNETSTALPSNDQVLTARVTDGKKVTGTAGEACDGSPISSKVVEWTIEADAPDAYISAHDGQTTSKTSGPGGDAQPNSITSSTDPSGVTSIALQLDEPGNASANTGEDRISALIEGTPDVPEPGSNSMCDLPGPVGFPCPGEGDNEDDVKLKWDPAATASPSVTPSSTATSSPSTSPEPKTRSVTLDVSEDVITSGDVVHLTGQLSSEDPFCMDAAEEVAILGRRPGSQPKSVAVGSTDLTGAFAVDVSVMSNTIYRAVAPPSDECPEARSEKIHVSAKVLVTLKELPSKRKGSVLFGGSVLPAHPGSHVNLQRQTRNGWVLVKLLALNDRSEFRIRSPITWPGERAFRVHWPSTDKDHASANSEVVVVEGHA